MFERFYRGRDGGRRRRHRASACRSSSRSSSCTTGRSRSTRSPGAGRTFRRAAAGRRSAARSRRERSRRSAARRVLVVDDERRDRRADRRPAGPARRRQVEVATSGEEALAALRAGRFDAVTLDILMPGMDGFEVLRAHPRRSRAAQHADRVRVGLLRRAASSRVSGSYRSRSTPTSCARSSAPRSQLGALACSWSGARSCSRCSSPRSTSFGIEHDWELSGRGRRPRLRRAALRGGAGRRRHPQSPGGRSRRSTCAAAGCAGP